MKKQNKTEARLSSNVLGGVLLIVLGTIFLAGQLFDIGLGHKVWPLAIIIPGVILFWSALAWVEKASQALAAVSGVVTMVGIVLLVQSLTGWWASWAYAWALVVPTGPGLGMWLLGVMQERAKLARSGRDVSRLGLFIFVVGALFFELFLGINGPGVRYGLSLLLMGLGLILLIGNMCTFWQRHSQSRVH